MQLQNIKYNMSQKIEKMPHKIFRPCNVLILKAKQDLFEEAQSNSSNNYTGSP